MKVGRHLAVGTGEGPDVQCSGSCQEGVNSGVYPSGGALAATGRAWDAASGVVLGL